MFRLPLSFSLTLLRDIEVEFDTTQEEKNQRIQALAEETARAIESL